MSEEKNLEIVKKLMQKYEECSVDPPPLDELEDGVNWFIYGGYDDPLTGKFKGIKAVQELFIKFNELVEPQQHDAREYIAKDDKVVVYGDERVRFKRSNRTLDSHFVYVFTLQNSKITEFQGMYGY